MGRTFLRRPGDTGSHVCKGYDRTSIGEAALVTASKVRAPSPRNGEFYVALMIGGTHELVAAYRKLLAPEGVLLRDHWPTGNRTRSAVHASVDIIMLVPCAPWENAQRREFAARELQLGRHVIDARHHDEVVQTLRYQRWVAAPINSTPLAGVISIVPPPPPPVLVPAPPIAPLPDPPPAPPEPDPLPLAATRPPEPKEHHADMVTTKLEDQERQALVAAGRQLYDRRRELNLSSSAVAEKIGKSEGYVYAVERAAVRISHDAADKIERVYGLAAGTLPRLAKLSTGPKKRGRIDDMPRKTETKRNTATTAVVPAVNRADLIAALIRIHAELAGIGVEDLNIKARHGDDMIEITADSFVVRRA